jgi:hypothetical protein
MVIFFVMSNLTVPLVVKCLEQEPLDYKLKYTTLTFGYALAGTVTLIASHWLYSHVTWIRNIRLKITHGLLEPTGIFKLPSEYQLWVMGFIGCAAHAVISGTQDINESKSIIAKACISLIPFTYAPFLMPFSFMVSDQKKTAKSNILIPIYFVFTVAIAMAANGRIGIVLPIVTAGMCWILGYFTLRLPNSFRRTQVLAVVLVIMVAMIPVFSNMALAMAAARREKEGATPIKLIQLSIAYFGDQKALTQVVLDSQSDELWDEVYVHNPILSRFVNTKYQDLGFTDTHSLTASDRAQYIDFLKDKTVGLLPAPVLDRLGYNIDKADRLSGGAADYLHYLNTGGGFGGKRTGSMLASGVFLFGVFFLPILLVASIFMYIATDAFCIVVTKRVHSVTGDGTKPEVIQTILFSPAILVMVWHAVYINFQFEMFEWIGVIFRNFPIQLVFYFLIIRLSNFLAVGNLLPKTSRAAN